MKALEARIAEDLRACSLRAALDKAQTEEEALRERMKEARKNLADTRNACWCKELPPLPTWAREMGSLAFLDGRWKSITPLESSSTGEDLDIVLNLENGRGRSRYLVGAAESKRTCRGTSRTTMGGKDFTIRISALRCPNRAEVFNPIRMVCSLTAQKTMVCCAHSGRESFGVELGGGG